MSYNNQNNEQYENFQIVRKDGRDCFVEILDSMFDKGKIIINFVHYNSSNGNKMDNSVSAFFEFNVFLRIANDILSGKTIKELQKFKKEKGFYTTMLYQGGKTDKETNKITTRTFKIFAGDKLPIMFIAESGNGKRDYSQKLYVPDWGKTPDQMVMMGLRQNDCKELFLMAKAAIEAYMSASYTVKLMNKK